MAKNVKLLNINSTEYTMRPYGTCSTAASTAAKVVSCTDFALDKGAGATILVKFTYSNTVGNATLNVNSTGAKNIYNNGAAITATTSWSAGSIVEFYYDGTNWNIISMNIPAANNTTTQGIVSTGNQIFGGEKTFAGKSTHSEGLNVPSNKNIEVGSAYIKYNSTTGCLEISC